MVALFGFNHFAQEPLSRRNVRKLIDVSTGSMRRMNIE
jgi:hypothetical protein